MQYYQKALWVIINIACGFRMVPKAVEYDYSYYLGPNYKQNQKLPANVSTIVMNHSHWVENIVMVYLEFCGFVIKAEVEKIPMLASVLAGLNCFYVQRTATKE